jgi:hypothetical protein
MAAEQEKATKKNNQKKRPKKATKKSNQKKRPKKATKKATNKKLPENFVSGSGSGFPAPGTGAPLARGRCAPLDPRLAHQLSVRQGV